MKSIVQILQDNQGLLPGGVTWTTEDEAADFRGEGTLGLRSVDGGYTDEGNTVTITAGSRELVISDFYEEVQDADGEWGPGALTGWDSVEIEDGEVPDERDDFDETIEDVIARIKDFVADA